MNSEEKYSFGALKRLSDVNAPLSDVDNPCPRTEELLQECQHFKSGHVMNYISTRCGVTGFSLAIEKLITLLIRETYGQLDPKERQDLSELKSQYNVQLASSGALDCLFYEKEYPMQLPTLERLRSMFPHVALAEKIKSIESNVESVNNNPKLHQVFYLPEFGGLIPITEKLLKKEEREALIILHLFAMERLKELPIPLYTRHVILKKQLESSLLNDDRRMHQLVRLGLIYGGGDLTPEIQVAFAEIYQHEPIFCKHVNFNALI